MTSSSVMHRNRYLDAMGIEVFIPRSAISTTGHNGASAPLTGPDSSPGRLWLLQYPGYLVALTLDPGESDPRAEFRRLIDDLVVALGGSYNNPAISCTGHRGNDVETAGDFASRTAANLPAGDPGHLLTMGEDAREQLLGQGVPSCLQNLQLL